jgi:transposase-like protein
LDARNNKFNQTRVPPLRSLLCEGFSTSCSAESIRAFVATKVASGATLKTDGLAAYLVLPWTCRVFANLKRWALGVYPGLRRNQFQSYLDAFVFRFNRCRSRCAALRSMLGIGA